MSTISASNHGSFSTSAQAKAQSKSPERTIEADPGPWLSITGPFLIALTVAVVSWLSMTSF